MSLEQENLSITLLKDGIKLSLNLLVASHHGGLWERLIRMLRKVLNAEGLCAVPSCVRQKQFSTVVPLLPFQLTHKT
jgi:hypothetical protein